MFWFLDLSETETKRSQNPGSAAIRSFRPERVVIAFRKKKLKQRTDICIQISRAEIIGSFGY
jgi:hypothetical protein